jgi:hypothetical protein
MSGKKGNRLAVVGAGFVPADSRGPRPPPLTRACDKFCQWAIKQDDALEKHYGKLFDAFRFGGDSAGARADLRLTVNELRRVARSFERYADRLERQIKS